MRLVAGGLHLAGQDRDAVRAAIAVLRDHKVDMVFPGHCTGDEAIREMRGRMPDRVIPLAAGMVIDGCRGAVARKNTGETRSRIGLIRCGEKRDGCRHVVPTCLKTTTQGFAGAEDPELMGVFTCRCPGDNVVALAKILKAKGAEVVHWCTCTFARREEGKWVLGGGFCDHADALLERISREAGIRCVKGTAHLPAGYVPETFGSE
jgi:predicted metal-binding protein